MKKRCVISLLLMLLLCGCASSGPLDEISEVIGADVRGGALAYLTDSHGGFHGDGETVARIQLTPEQAEAFLSGIQGNLQWHPLPLSENLSAAIYGRQTAAESFGPLFPEDTVPLVENGCWFFYDRSSQSTDPADDAPLHSRSSWNFTAAIFDADQNVLYYLELDT